MNKKFSELTLPDVELLRTKRSYSGKEGSVYKATEEEISNAKKHLESLYNGRVTVVFAERIYLLYQLNFCYC